VGIAFGDVTAQLDVDGSSNLIGEVVNTAARVANAPENEGWLFEADYVTHYEAIHTFHGKEVCATGKHEGEVFSCRGPAKLPSIPDSIAVEKLVDPEIDPCHGGVLLAYDLPGFSKGEQGQLVKRFRGVETAFSSLRAEGSLRESTSRYFAPGGDGGTYALSVNKVQGLKIAERLVELLNAESFGRDESISTTVRVGVHYSSIPLFLDANNVIRPAGLPCFVAEEISGDTIAKATHKGGSAQSLAVFTEAMLSPYSNQERSNLYYELPATSGLARKIARFARKS